MKLKDAINLPEMKDSETLGDLIHKIRIEAINIFNYHDIKSEYQELLDDFYNYGVEMGYNGETKLKDITF